MDEILRDLTTPALLTAIEENMFGFFRNSTLAEVHDDPELLWWISDSPFADFNMLFRARLTPERVEPAIDAILTQAHSKKVGLFWWTGPSTSPSTLESSLASHGFQREGLTGMAVDLNALQPAKAVPALVIERVRHKKALRPWCNVFVTGFGGASAAIDGWFDIYASVELSELHPMRFYLGSVDGVPVASSTLYLGAGVAGIYCVATLPEYRRRGIAAAMTALPLAEAKAQGYQVGVLQASAMGHNIYAGLGFRDYCDIGINMWSNEWRDATH